MYHGLFYQNTPASFFKTGAFSLPDPNNVDPELIKFGIHSTSHLLLFPQREALAYSRILVDWAQHGICGRGVLLDMVKYYTDKHGKLPYDPFTTHPIPLEDLQAAAKAQGVTFQPADILIIRAGFMVRYYSATQEERDGLSGKPETL